MAVLAIELGVCLVGAVIVGARSAAVMIGSRSPRLNADYLHAIRLQKGSSWSTGEMVPGLRLHAEDAIGSA